jgi:hypothetical protein
MKIDEAFPSKYLKASIDLPDDGDMILTIRDVQMERLGMGAEAEDKPVVYFNETPKGLVMNKTNWGTIAEVIGDDDTDTWEGRKIALYATEVEFQGKRSLGIRVRLRAPKAATKTTRKMETLEDGSKITILEDASNPVPF